MAQIGAIEVPVRLRPYSLRAVGTLCAQIGEAIDAYLTDEDPPDDVRADAQASLEDFRERANPQTATERWSYLDEAATLIEQLLVGSASRPSRAEEEYKNALRQIRDYKGYDIGRMAEIAESALECAHKRAPKCAHEPSSSS